MKKAVLTILEPTRAAVLIAFAIAVAIELHPVFLLVAVVIAIIAFAEAIVSAALLAFQSRPWRHN